jgi:P4 family phage/plasmid primase-like protien
MVVPQDASGVKSNNVAHLDEARQAKEEAKKDGAKPQEKKKEKGPSIELLFADHLKADDDIRIGGRTDQDDIELSLYKWNGAFWKMLQAPEMRKIALSWLKRRCKDRASRRTAVSCLETATDYMVDESNQDLSTLERARNKKEAYIPVKDAYLQIGSDGTIRPRKPSRDLGLTYTVPAAFDWKRVNPDGTYTPRAVDPDSAFGKYLDLFFPDHSVRILLQEACAASVLPINYEKAFVLTGDGSNGKSTLLHLLRALHPKNAAIRLKMVDGRFGFQGIAGKTLLIASEVPDFLGKDIEQNLKALISRDAIEIELKGKDSVCIVPRATLFLAVNEALKFSDHTYGNDRKYQIIPFTVRMEHQSSERKKDYHLLITENPTEMAQVLDWILEGAARLCKQGHFTPEPASVQTFVQDSQLTTDNVQRFLVETEARLDPDCWTVKMDIYTAYKEFCLDRSMKPVRDSDFWTRAQEIFKRKGQDYGNKYLAPNYQGKRFYACHLRVQGIKPAMAGVAE